MLEKGGGKHEHNERSRSYKKTQIKFLKMKSTVAETKNLLAEMNSRSDTKEKEISGLYDITIETIQNETKKKE